MKVNHLKKIIEKVDELSRITNEIGESFNGKFGSELKLKGFVFLDLLLRINSNLEGIYLLLKPYNDQPELKYPIALVLRACLSDVLTGYYLLSFQKDEKSFENEIKVLGLDYLNYAKSMVKTEPLFSKLNSKELLESKIKENESILFDRYKEYIKSTEDGKIQFYSVAELRKTSKDELFIIRGERSRKPTDKNKFERLSHIRLLQDALYIYPLMRYYAQYQHYTFEGREINRVDPNENLKFFIQSIYYIGHAIRYFGGFIGAKQDSLERIVTLINSFEDFPGAMSKD